MALTKAQRTRLDKLATYLEGLPEDYDHFDMSNWIIGGEDNDAVIQYALKNGGVPTCGTAACAAGHGPAAGILVPRRFIASGEVDWDGYCELFVGSASGRLSFWCFGSDWQDVDDHHFGAAARIRYLLANGEPPPWFYGAELCHVADYAPYRIDAKAPADA